MSKLDDALKRFEQVATLGMRESDYIQVDNSLALFREDLAVVKTALSKKDELLKLYERLSYYSKYDVFDKETRERVFEIKDGILELKKELGEVK